MSPSGPSVLVVANPAEAKLIAGWLRDDGLTDVRTGDGGDDTLTDFQARAAQVVVMTATLAAGDALALAAALHDESAAPALVLVGDEKGPVRTALDAIDFGAQRFLRRPLAKPALIYSVRSTAGRQPVAAPADIVPLPVSDMPSAGLVAAMALPALGGALLDTTAGALDAFALAPAAGGAPLSPQASQTDGGVAQHAASARLSEVVERAIDSFLNDAMADAFSAPPIELTDEEIEEMEALEEIEATDDMLEPPSISFTAEPASPDELADAPEQSFIAEPASPEELAAASEHSFTDEQAAGEAAESFTEEPVIPEVAEPFSEDAAADPLAGDAASADSFADEPPAPAEPFADEPVAPAEDSFIDEPIAPASVDSFVDEPIAPASADSFIDEPIAPAFADSIAGEPVAPVAADSVAEPPPWREPTQIISGPARSEPALPGATSGAAGDPVVMPIAPEEARTGTFVSELKRTMSAIEQRLFGADEAAPGAGYDEAPPDIDLDAIAVDSTIPGGVAYDAERRLLGRNLPLPVESDFADEDRDGGMEPGERRTPPPRSPTGPGMRGELREDDVAFLVARLHREGFSGRVTFRRGEAQKGIFFEEGRLVFATSNLPHDRMGDLLYREGKITREQHARSREIVAETGRRMGEILVEMGFLKRRELLPAVRRHVEDVIYSLFAWDGGIWSMTPGDGAQDEKIRLATHPTALVIEGIRRKMGLDRLRERLGPSSTVIAPLKRDDVTGALAEVDLSAEERRAADLLDGRRTLAEIAAAAKLEETSVYQLAYGLVALGLARVVESRENTSQIRGMNVHSAPAGTQSLVGAVDVAIDRERVLAKHAHVVEADYFAVLGVRRDATAFEIRRAYEAARRDYAAEAFPQEVQREHGAELREIAAVLEEAYRVLRDDRVRGQYLTNLRE